MKKCPYVLGRTIFYFSNLIMITNNAAEGKITVTRGKSATLKTMVMVLRTSEHVYATKWRRLWGLLLGKLET